MTPEQLEYHRNWRLKNIHKVRRSARYWQKRNPEKVRENSRKWRKTWTPEQREKYAETKRLKTFKRKYGMEYGDYEKILEHQNGHCALCPRTPHQERYKRLNVDHDHNTGKVRGLLCTPCNYALGLLGDNIEGLTRAINYLETELKWA